MLERHSSHPIGQINGRKVDAELQEVTTERSIPKRINIFRIEMYPESAEALALRCCLHLETLGLELGASCAQGTLAFYQLNYMNGIFTPK
jgi:hypothetical protein